MDTRRVFRGLSRKMREDFNVSAEIRHQGSRGTYREDALKRFLSDGRLPSRYGIGAGEIVGRIRDVSRQSDLVLYDQLNGVALIYGENIQVFPIECVAGTVEVKSTLNKVQLIESLENIKSVKKLAPRESVTKTVSGFSMSYPRPSPFGAVFGYRLVGNSLSSLVDNLKEWEMGTPKEYWPNVIAILGEGIIHHYKDGLRIAYTNSDLRNATVPSYIQYEEDTLFKFYSALIDLCASSDPGPVVLSRYFDQAEQLGEYVVSNHDRFVRNDCNAVFKLSLDFVSRVVHYSREHGPLTQGELLTRRLGQIPNGTPMEELQEMVYLYNPDSLRGIHEVETPFYDRDGIPVASYEVMEPGVFIVVNGEAYFIPGRYIEGNTEKIPGRTISDL